MKKIITEDRIWDKINKKMYYPQKKEFFDDMIRVRYEHFETTKKNLIALKCLGRSDIDKKLIYQADIIKYVGKNKNSQAILDFTDVKWQDNLCGFFPFNLYSENVIFHNPKEYRVIGNIYENPNLLKELSKKLNKKSQKKSFSYKYINKIIGFLNV